VARRGQLDRHRGVDPGAPPGGGGGLGAAFNFLAFLLFGTHVAQTVGGGLVDVTRVAEDWRLWVLLCALLGAIAWDVVTWWFGLPSSSSHALVGGYAGAAITGPAGHRRFLRWPAPGEGLDSYLELHPLSPAAGGWCIEVRIQPFAWSRPAKEPPVTSWAVIAAPAYPPTRA